jgi:biopolymer transport protein ExbD
MRRSRRQPSKEIPQASLADMAFLLLIFFIATTTFAIEYGLPLVLPSARRSAVLSVRPQDVFRIQIYADGRVLANGLPIRLEELGGRLREANVARQAARREELVAVIETEPRAAYHLMVEALDQVRIAAARRIALKQLEVGSR